MAYIPIISVSASDKELFMGFNFLILQNRYRNINI